MPHYAFGVTYHGVAFHGWQRQADVDTVQGALEQALSRVADHPVDVRVAGRTDAGVHATGQVAGFTSRAQRKPRDWLRGVNALTPKTVRVDWLQPVDAVFHPRYSATARRYVYVFHDAGAAHPLLDGQVWACAPLDADAMHRAAQVLIGEHDFSSFRAAGCQSLTPMRRLHRCDVIRRGEFVVMDIEANAFLLHMVRNIARGLHDVGAGIAERDMASLLGLRDRTVLGATAPPGGLYLAAVSYPGFDFPAAGRVPLVGV
jgi:tRNA pseudouridine38-40 synthase